MAIALLTTLYGALIANLFSIGLVYIESSKTREEY
jgi:flagellar motor component MotA